MLNRKRLADRLNLRRLPQDGVTSMLAALGGPEPPHTLVEGIYRETEGNPFFVEEVFQHLREEGTLFREDGGWLADLDLEELDVPEGVRLVIGRRLERVSHDSLKVLTFGAVVGRGFSLDLLEAIGEVTGDALLTALEEAETNHLIMPMRGREPRWEFSHALIRQTLAAGLSVPSRQQLHLRVADAMERAAGSNADKHASDLAHYLFQAGAAADPGKTVRFLSLAGDLALGTGAFDETLRRFDDALSIQDLDNPLQVANLRYNKGRRLRSLGRWEEAIKDWKMVLPLYEELGDRAASATVCWEMALLLAWKGRASEAVRVVRRGLEVLGPEASADRCRLLASGGMALGLSAERSDEVVAGDEMLTQSIAMAEALEDPRAHREALQVSAYKHFLCMRRRDQADTALRAAELLRSGGDLWNLADTLTLFQLASVFRGRLDGVARFEDETDDLVQRLGNIGAYMFATYAIFDRDWLMAADLDKFEASAQRIVEVCARANMPRGVFLRPGWPWRVSGEATGRQHETGPRTLPVGSRQGS